MVAGQIAFFVDATKCINCKTCEIACKDFNALGCGEADSQGPPSSKGASSRGCSPTTSRCLLQSL